MTTYKLIFILLPNLFAMKFKKIEKQKLFAHGENLLIRGNKSVKYLSVGFCQNRFEVSNSGLLYSISTLWQYGLSNFQGGSHKLCRTICGRSTYNIFFSVC